LREAGVRYIQGYLLARPALNKLVSDGEIAYQNAE
jgi:EAL domain-containing protein (putative c-di-GMP-specific phosphodiesterase class I)